jgi:hypothetical protein
MMLDPSSFALPSRTTKKIEYSLKMCTQEAAKDGINEHVSQLLIAITGGGDILPIYLRGIES